MISKNEGWLFAGRSGQAFGHLLLDGAGDGRVGEFETFLASGRDVVPKYLSYLRIIPSAITVPFLMIIVVVPGAEMTVCPVGGSLK